MRTAIALMAALPVLAACITAVPPTLREPANAVSFGAARADLDAHRGQPIRWGGTIIHIENRASETRLEVLARPLADDARPNLDGPSKGRFIATYSGFLDPYVYTADREITVIGILTGSEARTIGSFLYRYPVIHAATVYVWPARDNRAVDDPFYYDPWWPSPWYPWGYPFYYPYPYYRSPYWR